MRGCRQPAGAAKSAGNAVIQWVKKTACGFRNAVAIAAMVDSGPFR